MLMGETAVMKEQEETAILHLKFVSIAASLSSLIVTLFLWFFFDQAGSVRATAVTRLSTITTLLLIGSAVLAYSRYSRVGVWILVITMAFAIPAAAIFLSGLGTPLVVSAALTVFIIVVQALPKRQLIVASLLMGLAVLSAFVVNVIGSDYVLNISEESLLWLENLQTTVIIIFMLIVMRETVQRRQIEAELKEQNTALAISEQMYRQLVESAGDIVYTTDIDDYIKYINPVGVKWTGYLQEQLIGMHFTALLPLEWQVRVNSFYTRQKEQRSSETTFEFPVQVSGQFTRWAQQRTSLLVDAEGKIVGLHHTIRDISKRKMMEEALQSQLVKTEAMYQMARSMISYRNLPDLLQVVANAIASALSADRTILYTFDLEEQSIGYFVKGGAHPELIRPFTYEELMAGLNGWVLQHNKPALAMKNIEDERVSPAVRQQRMALDIGSVIVSPVRYQGKILGTLTAINCLDEPDFTDEDVELMMALGNQVGMAIENVRLFQAERQYMIELHAQNEELDAFSHTVAHDLFSPLTALIGFVDLLTESFETHSVTKDQKKMVTIIREVSHKMVNIIDELLLLAQVRKAEVPIDVVDMQQVVADVWQRLVYMTQEYDAELITPQEWPQVMGYGPWIEEIWVNYVSNALKYGGQPPRVELGCTLLSSQHAQFWVRDNGVGLTAEAQASLFTPFERLNQLNIKGHGLGLSIVQRIAEKLNGNVGLESALGEGTVFYFILPLVE